MRSSTTWVRAQPRVSSHAPPCFAVLVLWSSVFLLVGLVKRLPYPWRSIVDGGVCAGLAWGGASILVYYVRALLGTPPAVDPELP